MYDAIVIGSGFAGLVAARTIAQANKKVILLEVSLDQSPNLRGHRSWIRT